ncbi:unnamed protein product [Polarella glacialis]|uniref:Uncharacterized protein n=1 Tax=Polarella glacialis TaxID=89957 RepID=A0A813KNC2_POLGL|nr:unnamed protein product [Polarella glacialis]
MPSSDSVGSGSAISSVQSKMKVGMEAVLTQAIQSALTDAGVTVAITVTAIAEPTITGAPPTTTTALTEDTPNATSRTKVDIMGQSGKFTVYDERSGKGSGIQLTMDALREVDADGNSVGASGSVKHSINTFAAQDFSIADAEDVTLGNRQVPALKISFSSSISTIGKIKVDTYVIGKSGLLGPPGEEWAVLPGDLKWSIELSEWNWCGCSKGQTTEEGAFVDLDISVKGLGTAQANAGSNKSLSLGGGVNLELSSQTYSDGAWVSMPEGYPKIVMQGSSTMFTFRFPKFSTSSLYDPVLTGLNAAAESSDSSTTTGPGTTSAGPGTTSEGPGVTSEGGGTITTSLPATSAAPPTVITGDFSFTVDNCTSFIGQNSARDAISSGLATTLGVSSDYIQTALGCTARRLASAVVPARHLSEAVKATYTITMPSSDSVGSGSAISSVQSKMKVGMEAVLTQAIQSALTDAGVTVAITVTAIAEPTITGAPPTTTTALTEDLYGSAQKGASMLLAAVVAMAMTALA